MGGYPSEVKATTTAPFCHTPAIPTKKAHTSPSPNAVNDFTLDDLAGVFAPGGQRRERFFRP